MSLPRARIEDIVLTSMSKIRAMEARLESMEHLLNQQSMLEGTLGDIMEVLRKQER